MSTDNPSSCGGKFTVNANLYPELSAYLNRITQPKIRSQVLVQLAAERLREMQLEQPTKPVTGRAVVARRTLPTPQPLDSTPSPPAPISSPAQAFDSQGFSERIEPLQQPRSISPAPQSSPPPVNEQIPQSSQPTPSPAPAAPLASTPSETETPPTARIIHPSKQSPAARAAARFDDTFLGRNRNNNNR